MRPAVVCFILCVACCTAMAQNMAYRLGPRENGMGFCGATSTTPWALYHNPAGLAELETFTAGTTFEIPYFIEGLNLGSVTAGLPFSWGTTSLGAVVLHQPGLQTTQISGGYGRLFGNSFSAGMTIHYHLFQATGRPAHPAVFTVDAGVKYTVSKKLTAGAHVFNATTTRKNAELNEDMPVGGRLGITYQPASSFLLSTEMGLEYPEAATLRVGAEFTAHEVLSLRAGLQTYPRAYTLGVGFEAKALSLGIQYMSILTIGSTASIGMSYAF